MQKVIYYVATSIDGYISGPSEDISMFAQSGEGVDQYLSDLKKFKTVIMGRKTYEFGFKYGLIPGQPAYPHMQHHIFSETLELDDLADSVQVEKMSLDRVRQIRDSSSTDVYLCGGGQFAGWLMENRLIDELKIKLNPIILGGGVRIFGDSKTKLTWKLKESSKYENGLQIITYSLK